MTDLKLSNEEIRVLGCLMEKEMATPEYYPLSLNSLVNACNQKSNREPVTSYSESSVYKALNGLRIKGLAMESGGSRVSKYAQTFSQKNQMTQSEEAVMCILFVRGPQTAGEIKGRTERLYGFSSLEETQEVIGKLEYRELVKKLPKQPGRKESRYIHTLSNEAEIIEPEVENVSYEPVSDIIDNDEINELKLEVESLRNELHDLRMEFEAFKAQFS